MDEHPKKIAPAEPASSLLLIRDGRGGLEVLMIERAKTMRFAPGAFVFPGGKVDKEDGQRWRWQRYLSNPRARLRDLSFRIAAARELYEEVDILLGDINPALRVSGKLDFETMLKRTNARLELADMVPFAHWVTPETIPRRFDTYFYLTADADHVEQHDGEEAVSSCWVKPREILEEWAAENVPLMFPTRLNLMKLARSSTVAAALQATRQAPIVTTLPKIRHTVDGVQLSIPPETGFGVTNATEFELNVERPPSLSKK